MLLETKKQVMRYKLQIKEQLAQAQNKKLLSPKRQRKPRSRSAYSDDEDHKLDESAEFDFNSQKDY